MLLHKLVLLLPAVILSASAAPTVDNQVVLHSPVGLSAHIDTSGASSACTDVLEFFGKRKWTYIQAQWCLVQRGATTIVSQQLSDPWYYWGGVWHKGGNRKLSWTTNGQVSPYEGEGKSFGGAGTSDGIGTAEIATLEPKLASGDYYISIDFNLVGPFWERDAAIDAHFGATGLRLDD